MREREKVFDPGRPMIRENKYRVEFLRASASTNFNEKLWFGGRIQPDSGPEPILFASRECRFNGVARVQTSKVPGSTQNGSLRPPRITPKIPQLISRTRPRELVGPREANFITLHFPISRLTLSKDKIHPTSNIPDTCIIFPSIEVEKKGEKTMLAL